MSYFNRTFLGNDTTTNPTTYWVHWDVTQENFSHSNKNFPTTLVDDCSTPISLAVGGRTFLIRLAPPTQQDLIEDETMIGTYGLVSQSFGHQKYLEFLDPTQPDPDDENRDIPIETMLRVRHTVVDLNIMPPLRSQFKVFRNVDSSDVPDGTYSFRCAAYSLTATNGVRGFVTAVNTASGAGFYNTAAKVPTAPQITAFTPIYNISTGPVLPTSINPTTGAIVSGFTYLVSSNWVYTPAAGYDFNWKQLTWGSTTGVTQTTGTDANTQTWVFIPVKSKLNTPADSIYSYKIRVLGGDATTGFLTATARNITGDEFELVPHSQIFGSFTIRSVAHGETLKHYLQASTSTSSVSWPVAAAPAATVYSWQIRPVSNTFSTTTSQSLTVNTKPATTERAVDETLEA